MSGQSDLRYLSLVYIIQYMRHFNLYARLELVTACVDPEEGTGVRIPPDKSQVVKVVLRNTGTDPWKSNCTPPLGSNCFSRVSVL